MEDLESEDSETDDLDKKKIKPEETEEEEDETWYPNMRQCLVSRPWLLVVYLLAAVITDLRRAIALFDHHRLAQLRSLLGPERQGDRPEQVGRQHSRLLREARLTLNGNTALRSCVVCSVSS
jgi:hypothetical protein